MTRILLDTSVLIDDERSGELEAHLPEDADLAIAAITLAELGTGVELASPRHRPARAAYVAEVSTLPLVHYDGDVAAIHARLLAEVQRQGRPRGAHDLIIAATALATGRTVLTRDPRGFVGLPDLDVVVLGAS
jgi:tRNA(fMet)-specific endonuclease VapC